MDPTQVEELYRLYGFAVHRRCLRLLRTQAAADDALQEVFVRVLRYGANLEQDLPLGWLYRTADHVCFDRLERERRQRAREQGAENEVPREPEAPDARQLVLELLAVARPHEREAAVLYFVDGLSQAEIATSLGCSRELVTQRLARFRSAARKLLLRGESP